MLETISYRKLTVDSYHLVEVLEATENERRMKNESKCALEKWVQKLWKNANVVAFGSSENGFEMSCSDLDVCILFKDWGEKEYLNTDRSVLLDQLATFLRFSKYQVVEMIKNARVPILKLWDRKMEVHCDVSIGNYQAILNTKLCKFYGQIDPRVKPLTYLMKYFAMQRGINNASQGTLSAYSYVLMTIYFLQVKGILPVLDASNDAEWEKVVQLAPEDFGEKATFGGTMQQSVGKLVLDMFRFYAYEFDMERDVISIRKQGLQKWNTWQHPLKWRISIQDPIQQHHDLGRVIYHPALQQCILLDFQRAYRLLFQGISISIVCTPRCVSNATQHHCIKRSSTPP